MNRPEIDIGDELRNLKSFTKDLDPQTKGLALGNSEVIRKVHNSFSRPEPFIFDNKKKAKKGDDVFHFVAYVPVRGKLYLIDGLMPGPVVYELNKE